MREIIQLVVSFTGSLGFAALFNIHGKKLWFAALGGCLSWAVYLAVEFITPSPDSQGRCKASQDSLRESRLQQEG